MEKNIIHLQWFDTAHQTNAQKNNVMFYDDSPTKEPKFKAFKVILFKKEYFLSNWTYINCISSVKNNTYLELIVKRYF